jgi:competence protein ComEC
MADWGRGQSKGQVGTWDARQRRRRALAWTGGMPDFGRAATERLRHWAIADTGPGRLLPWLPVAFGFGIAIYFTAAREPALWAASGLAALCCAIAIAARRRPIAFPLALAGTAIAAGFTVATFTTLRVAHPVLARPAGNVAIAGFVEVREERERTDRIVVRALSLEGNRIEHKPDRIRVSVKKGAAPPVGAYVSFRARLSPPLEPLRPGGYDFARDLYFQGIGATGFVLGAIKPAEASSPPGLWLKYAAAVQGLRDAIDARIRAVIPGDKGAIASALITGKRDAISVPVNDAMYISSLAHVLSISGYQIR